MEGEQFRFKPVESNPEAVYRKVWQKIEGGKGVAPEPSPFWKYMAVAASLALLVVSSLFFFGGKGGSVDYIDIVATAGSNTHIVLPDSSSVWLNSNARIRYPMKFTSGRREVELSGEAFFDVRGDKAKPFTIQMDGMRVKVMGTSFNIHSEEGKDIIEVTLVSGSVGLFAGGNNGAAADRLLQPGQQALYSRSGHTFDVRRVRSEMYSCWVTGQFFFENNSLQEIMSSLERAFNTRIFIEGEALKDTRLTAQFIHKETLDEILSILQTPAKYKYKKEDGRIYISPV